MDTYCTVAECEALTREGRIRCDFHEKRHQRGQPLTAPKAERLTPKARLLEAAIRLADAETDEDYAKAERDTLKAARHLSPSALGELVRQGMAQARRRGVTFGRRPVLTSAQAQALVKHHGSMAAAAEAARVSRVTLWRALRRVSQASLSQRVA
jgi:hypothetical protein